MKPAICEPCSSCGVPSFPLVETHAVIGTGSRSWVKVHRACGRCLGEYQAQQEQNRRDEEQARKAMADRRGKKAS